MQEGVEVMVVEGAVLEVGKVVVNGADFGVEVGGVGKEIGW